MVEEVVHVLDLQLTVITLGNWFFSMGLPNRHSKSTIALLIGYELRRFEWLGLPVLLELLVCRAGFEMDTHWTRLAVFKKKENQICSPNCWFNYFLKKPKPISHQHTFKCSFSIFTQHITVNLWISKNLVAHRQRNANFSLDTLKFQQLHAI